MTSYLYQNLQEEIGNQFPDIYNTVIILTQEI